MRGTGSSIEHSLRQMSLGESFFQTALGSPEEHIFLKPYVRVLTRASRAVAPAGYVLFPGLLLFRAVAAVCKPPSSRVLMHLRTCGVHRKTKGTRGLPAHLGPGQTLSSDS